MYFCMSDALYALYGGTFDPIHFGHLNPVAALAEEIDLTQVVFLPNNVPPHRPQPEANGQQRLEMLNLAIADNPLFALDVRELKRDTPSWTVDTLEAWRAEHGNQPLAFIIGQDSLLSLPHWHRWEMLLSLCHLVVLRRCGYPQDLPDARHQRWLENNRTTEITALRRTPAGKIYLANTPLWDISATEIRRRLAAGESVDTLIPECVARYIRTQKLYGAQ